METIRFSLIGAEDISVGTGSFEVRLADERVVAKNQINGRTILPNLTTNSVLIMGASDITEDTTFVFNPTTNTLTTPAIDGGSSSGGDLTIDSTSHATKGDILLQPDSGNVGIGVTASPDTVLHVAATGSSVVTIENDSGASTGDPAVLFKIANTDKFVMGVDDSDSDKLKIGTGSTLGATTAITVDSSRNVGIGQETPAGKVHITSNASGAAAVSSSADELLIENNTNAGISIRTPGTFTGAINFDDPGQSGAGALQYNHNADQMAFVAGGDTIIRVNSGGSVLINETSDTLNTNGLIVNQENADDHVLTLKSNDVATNATTLAQSDTFGFFQKEDATGGGLHVIGVSDNEEGLVLEGIHATNDNTQTTSSNGSVELVGGLISGTTRGLAANTDNILAIRNNTTTLGIVKGDGDTLLSGSLRSGSFGTADATLHAATTTGGKLRVENTSASDGDNLVEFYKEGAAQWIVGVDDSNSDHFVIEDSAAPSSAPHLLLSSTNNAIVMGSNTLNTLNTGGLTIDQGSLDTEIISLKSSDVAHGMTTLTETDTYTVIAKNDATDGGILLAGYTEGTVGLQVRGRNTLEDTNSTTVAVAGVLLSSALKSGTTVTTHGAGANLLGVQDGDALRFIVKQDGDVFNNGGSTAMTTFDDHDDVQLLEAVKSVYIPDFRTHLGQWVEDHLEILEDGGVITKDANAIGGYWISQKGMTGLLIDAIRQLNNRIVALGG